MTPRRRRVALMGGVLVVAGMLMAWSKVTLAGPAAGPASAGISAQGSPSGPPPEPISQGEFLFRRDCAWCHGSGGAGTERGPALIGTGAASVDFMLSTGRMPISNPGARVARAAPAYARDQIDQLARYVQQAMGGPEIPPVDPAAGDPAAGAQLYQINCAACHSSTGAGGALTNGVVAPDLRHSTPRQIAEAVRIGGAGVRTGRMPPFDERALSDQELNSVVRYVQAIQRPSTRGGAELGRLGPVAEGFIAWVVGLGVLLVFIRFIGTRRGE
jgi:ubiquinol-cytochrome c reductase cytochrome c subunit